jgi:hypothetical protein
MKIQGFKRLIIEDFDEKDRPLASKVANVLNVFAEEVGSALNKNLSIEDNLNSTIKSITVIVDANGVPVSKTSVSSGLQTLCSGIQVIRAINQTSPSLSSISCPFITFVDNGGDINISKITGLQANNKYLLRIILYP